jgi:hypothetical protein
MATSRGEFPSISTRRCSPRKLSTNKIYLSVHHKQKNLKQK